MAYIKIPVCPNCGRMLVAEVHRAGEYVSIEWTCPTNDHTCIHSRKLIDPTWVEIKEP